MKPTEDLKQAFLDADKEYQFAIAAGEPARLTAALKNWRQSFDRYAAAVKKELKKSRK